MIGYYIHHHGKGHLHRAAAIAAASSQPIVGLSSLPRPREWVGPWVQLAEDSSGTTESATANGRLHWAPLGHPGHRDRMAEISSWIRDVRPTSMVVDVSVEVVLLARLHGLPVVTVLQPGDRSDPVHELGYAVSDALIGCWPPGAGPVKLSADIDESRIHEIGGLSRFEVYEPLPRQSAGPAHAVVLTGGGGDDLTPERLETIQRAQPQWRWTVLGTHGVWVDDPAELLRTADVVVAHAGQNAIAEIAALRIPAVVLPQDRPHDEQRFLAAALTSGPWPAFASPSVDAGWASVLDEARCADGSRWALWCDGRAVDRFLAVCGSVALDTAEASSE